MKLLVFVFLGGGIGSVLRYLLTIGIQRPSESAFPWATFLINILGCILIGVFYALSARLQFNQETRLLLTVGICGGFTTFSTFSNESLQLLRSGSYLLFFLYVMGSILLGIAGVLLGNNLCR